MAGAIRNIANNNVPKGLKGVCLIFMVLIDKKNFDDKNNIFR